MQVVDYTDPNAEPRWVMRSLGVATSVDHTSETQVAGLRARLQELAKVFNESPLALRTGLRFDPDDFAYKLIGTSGDHAADQKKSHRVIETWKLEVIYQRMGEEALFAMDNLRAVALLLALTAQQIELSGGQDAWDKLSEDERAQSHTTVVRKIGKQVVENLPSDDKEKLCRFVRTGCCMHKDLNCFKAGDKALQEMWGLEKRTLPVLLANKENAQVLAGAKEGEERTVDQQRALEASKRGGSKATELGGLICNNSDTKKGQQDTYKFWMLTFYGRNVPYPDVCNTRYGSHGEAAGVILTHLNGFVEFMPHLQRKKDRPYTNIEVNFAAALSDIPTLTELAALALYNAAVSRPFMRYVRLHGNLLELEPFFKRKVELLARVIENPKIWTASVTNLKDVFIDQEVPEAYGTAVFEACHKLAPTLPDLDAAVKAFATGARTAFVERFSDEFKEGGSIDKMTAEERKELYFPSTNDVNEGALGAWRLAQRTRVAETLHKFNASKQAAINGTEDFISNVLTEEEDDAYLRRVARARDASKLQLQMKRAQIEADKKKAEETRQKELKKIQRQDEARAAVLETGKNLVLEDSGIDGLGCKELDRQLDFHRDAERALDIPEKVPIKSDVKLKAQKAAALKKAAERYRARLVAQVPVPQPSVPSPVSLTPVFDSNYEYDFYDDHY